MRFAPAIADVPVIGGWANNLVFSYQDSPATTSATTYKLRVGPGTAGTVRMNGYTVSREFGGGMHAQQ